ncbi:hypothetical protein OUZ56_002580 [Daphnia magna]|uniref:Uncharacterized protein n=1 Tax=Daphnia magna TaxID=35525 RepID=A0ABR0A656_9CRUS|nr:hypothetical protein OUZ56_002580 [Daphnia magna]
MTNCILYLMGYKIQSRFVSCGNACQFTTLDSDTTEREQTFLATAISGLWGLCTLERGFVLTVQPVV